MILHVNKEPSEAAADTYPDTFHVEGDTIGRDAFVVSGFENVVFPGLIHKTATQAIDISLERVRFEELVGESREREVEVILQLAVSEFRWL